MAANTPLGNERGVEGARLPLQSVRCHDCTHGTLTTALVAGLRVQSLRCHECSRQTVPSAVIALPFGVAGTEPPRHLRHLCQQIA